MTPSSPGNGTQVLLTGNPEEDSAIIWQESVENVWMMMAAQEAIVEAEDDPTKPLPRGDRGRYYDSRFDPFRKLGQRLFNPEKITLRTKRLMLQDSQLAAAIQTVNNSVHAQGFKIVGGEEEHRKFIERMYARLPMHRVFEQVLSAFWVGHSIAEKVFETVTMIEDGKEVIRQVIKRYKVLPPETIEYKVSDQGILLRVIQNGSALGIAKEISFPPAKVNVFTYDGGLSDNFGNVYGESALKPVYKDWFFKEWIQKHQNKYLELVAGGFLVGNAGKGNRRKMAKALNLLSSNANIVLKEGQKIETIKPAPAGSAFMESVNYHDQQMMKALLVPVLLLGQNAKFGSRSLSETHFRLFQQARIMRLQQQLELWVQHDVEQMVIVNFGRQEEYPRFAFKFFSIEQQEKNANFILKLIKAGVLGENDIADAREFVGWKVADIIGRGPPLIQSGVGRPGASGSAGDSVTRGTGVEVGGDSNTEKLEAALQGIIQIDDLDDLDDRFEQFFEKLGTTLGSFLEELGG